MEHGRADTLALRTVVAIAAALEIRLDIEPRWRGGGLGRLLNAGHSAMHEQLAARFGRLPEWLIRPEASFAVYGERGVIDVLVFHPRTGALLVVELKTELVDVQALPGTVDRYTRLARRVAAERGWRASTVLLGRPSRHDDKPPPRECARDCPSRGASLRGPRHACLAA